jgi:hypothetical protein
VCSTGFAHAGLTHGLSRMMGNHPVRFLGEGAAAMPLPYPTVTPTLKIMHSDERDKETKPS